jgi:hypothetical protein
VDKWKLLGHIISKDEISFDPSRTEAIKKIILPKDKNTLQYFFGKINFLRRFISNFNEVVKPLNHLLKNDVPFKWDDHIKRDF